MRTGRLIAVLLQPIVLSGCLQSTALVKVNADGSGTIQNETLMTSAALAQMRQLTGVFGGADAKPIDPFSEEQMRQLAPQLGPGVTLVSTSPLKTPSAEGRQALYAFRDITTLRISEAPPSPGNTSIQAGGISVGRPAQSGAVTIDLAHTPGGNVLLTVHAPPDPLRGLLDQLGSGNRRGAPLPPGQMAMARQMLAGLHVAFRIEPAGRLVRTSSAYVDGQTVALFDIDLDSLLNDEAAFTRLQNAKTAAEAAEALKNVPGVKVNLEGDVTIEFAP